MDRKIVSKIVKASGVSFGEMILIHFWGEDADKEIANNFMTAVAETGATPVLLQQSRSVNRDIFLTAKESCYNEQYFDLFPWRTKPGEQFILKLSTLTAQNTSRFCCILRTGR